MSLLIFPLIIFGLYFLMLRPQQQRMRRQQELVKSIGVGDRVLTASGLIGRVVDESDDRLLLEIADGVVVEFLRLAVSRRLDESEPSFLSLSDEAELDGYEDEEPSYPEASDAEPSSQADEATEAEAALPAEAVAGDVAPTPSPAAGTEEHVTGAPASPASPVAGAVSPVSPDGPIPGTAAPAPGQDPH